MIAIIIMMFALFLRPTKGENTKAQRTRCQANLKQISLSLIMWAGDNDGRFPWQEPQVQNLSRLPVTIAATPQQPWQYFQTISNELGSPPLLTCPADTFRQPAASFSGTSNSIASPGFQNKSVSYFIGLNGRLKNAQAIQLGDRHMVRDNGPAFRDGTTGKVVDVDPQHAKWWSDPFSRFHQEGGNLAFYDGSVRFHNSAQLQDALQKARDAYGTNANHFLFPQ